MNENEFVRKDVYSSDTRYFDQRIDDLKERINDYKDSTNDQNSKLSILIGAVAVLFAGLQITAAILLWYFSR